MLDKMDETLSVPREGIKENGPAFSTFITQIADLAYGLSPVMFHEVLLTISDRCNPQN